MEGKLVTHILKESFKGADVVDFLKHLLRQIAGQVIFIWDGAKIHHCQAVKAFLSSGGARRLRLIRLPAYAPELNPDEGVWRWLKRALGNVCCSDLDTLRDELRVAIARLRGRKGLIRSFFEMSGLQL